MPRYQGSGYSTEEMLAWLIEDIMESFRVIRMREVADVMGLHKSALSRWVNARIAPTLDGIVQAAMRANEEARLAGYTWRYSLEGIPPRLIKVQHGPDTTD